MGRHRTYRQPVMRESLVLAACLKWFHWKRLFAYRQNTGAYKTESGHYVRYGVPGGSDIVSITPVVITPEMVGKTLGVYTATECKSENGKLTEPQERFRDHVLACGGIYIVARSTEDIERELAPLL